MKRRDVLKNGLAAVPFLFLPSQSFSSSPEAWRHMREWSHEEFSRYSKWVENMYEFKRNGSSRQKMAKLGIILGDK